jgi:hypothetical protein
VRKRTGCGTAGLAGELAPPPHGVVADVSLNFFGFDPNRSPAESDADAVQTLLVEEPVNAASFHAKQLGDVFHGQ